MPKYTRRHTKRGGWAWLDSLKSKAATVSGDLQSRASTFSDSAKGKLGAVKSGNWWSFGSTPPVPQMPMNESMSQEPQSYAGGRKRNRRTKRNRSHVRQRR